jgi:hypothetical protein
MTEPVVAAEPAEVGDLRDGGVVFWVDPEDNTKGLVCALEDSANAPWINISPVILGTATAIGTGSENTDLIIDSDSGTNAASVARAYRGGGFEGWFLPSRDELAEIFKNLEFLEVDGMQELSGSRYWSSSDIKSSKAIYYYVDREIMKHNPKSLYNSIRAVRAF